MNKKILIAFIATVAMVFVMRWNGNHLITSITPRGVIDFELAGNFSASQMMMTAVGKPALETNIYLDFIFIIAYSFFFFLCCKYLMDRFRSSGLRTLGFIFLELGVLVGVLDISENILMLITLNHHGSDFLSKFTYWVAISKFSVAGLVVLFIVVGYLLSSLYKKLNK